MKAVFGSEKYLTLAMVVAAAALGAALLWEWEQGLGLEQALAKMRKVPVTAVPAQKILPEFTLPDAKTGFPELLSRPMFSISRRSSATGGPAGAMKKGQFVLVGVIITPQQRSALLRDVATNKTETVALVGVLRGLTLGDVQADRVVLRQGAESEELLLNVQLGPKLPAVPTTQAAASKAAGLPFVVPTPSAGPATSAAPPPGPVKPVPAPTVPRELTAQERALAEQRQQDALAQIKNRRLTTPANGQNGAGSN